MRIGLRVRKKRHERRWSARRLAEVTGISKNTILKVECGNSCMFETIVRIAAALDMDMNELAKQELKRDRRTRGPKEPLLAARRTL